MRVGGVFMALQICKFQKCGNYKNVFYLAASKLCFYSKKKCFAVRGYGKCLIFSGFVGYLRRFLRALKKLA